DLDQRGVFGAAFGQRAGQTDVAILIQHLRVADIHDQKDHDIGKNIDQCHQWQRRVFHAAVAARHAAGARGGFHGFAPAAVSSRTGASRTGASPKATSGNSSASTALAATTVLYERTLSTAVINVRYGVSASDRMVIDFFSIAFSASSFFRSCM